MSAYSEAKALEESLPPSGAVTALIAQVFNALLAEAKKQAPDSISLAAMEPLTIGRTGFVAAQTTASLRPMVAVVAAALRPPPPAG